MVCELKWDGFYLTEKEVKLVWNAKPRWRRFSPRSHNCTRTVFYQFEDHMKIGVQRILETDGVM